MMVLMGEPISWTEAEPGLVERERAAMAIAAPDMHWHSELLGPAGRIQVGWEGHAPAWGGDRTRPLGVEELLNGRRLRLQVLYPEAFPAVPPQLLPLDPEVPIERRTLTQWHVNGDGTLCLFQSAIDWDLHETAAMLVRKAANWFIEYQLADAGRIEHMTVWGLAHDRSLDEILAEYAR
jgi:hypothetical protein